MVFYLNYVNDARNTIPVHTFYKNRMIPDDENIRLLPGKPFKVHWVRISGDTMLISDQFFTYVLVTWNIT